MPPLGTILKRDHLQISRGLLLTISFLVGTSINSPLSHPENILNIQSCQIFQV